LPNETQPAGAHLFSHDRRRFLRRRVKSLAYIDLGNDSGGIVLNISEGGLSLHSAVVLSRRPLPFIRFQLPDSSAWVTARADIAWINPSRKQAGIRFSNLPDDARGQIRTWIASTHAEEAGSDNSLLGRAMKLASLKLGQVSTTSLAPPPGADDHDHTLRLHFPGRGHASERGRPSRKEQRIWWSLIAAVGSLAILSFALGWVAARGKLNKLPRILAEVTDRVIAHARKAPLTHALPAGAVASAPSIEPAPAGPLRLTTNPRVTITIKSYVPLPDAPRGAAGRLSTLQAGHILYRVDPAYPAQALARGVEGTVQLRASIGANGMVAGISVHSGPPLLAPAAEDAVHAWRYAPTLLNGKAVPTVQDVTLVFSLARVKEPASR
jgi:TonB family protein